ncbi:MAG: drug/metabolite exporter YedA [Phycisphaerales bacterium]|nr:drug/metabolite exporter YedA [Phycisphaerales bacterium]
MQPTHAPSRLRISIAFAAVYLIWGSTYLVIKLVSVHGAFVMAGLRFLLAGAILLAFAHWRGWTREGDFTRRSWLHSLCVGTGLMLLGNGGVAIATNSLDSGIVALMTAITPLWLVGLDAFMHRVDKVSRVVWVGIALGIAGIAVLRFGAVQAASAVSTTGIVLMFIACFGWAFGSVWSKRPGGAHSPIVATAMQMLAGGVVLMLASVPKEIMCHDEWTRLRDSPPDFTTILLSLYLVVFGSLFGFTAYIWLLRHQPAARVATYAYVNPVVALGLGALLLHEVISLQTVLACALMLGGVALIQLAKARKNFFPRAPATAE